MADEDGGPRALRLVTRDPSLLSAIADLAGRGGSLQPVLRVSVMGEGAPGDDPVPPVAGRYALPGDGIRFTPHFPFERGVRYRGSFDPRPLGLAEWQDVLTLDVAPEAVRGGALPGVERVFPTADELPANLLRFYVRFSQPMRRGHAGAEVSLLGPDGQPVPDALYRAPVELWDRTMRCLTVLLDPGRLKRGVGPNRALGSPLRAGQGYTLAVGAGMTAASGRSLPEAVRKRFSATEPVREPVSADGWEVVPPAAGSREPLRLRFTRPLDWALLRRALAVDTGDGAAVAGHVEAGTLEKEVTFTPATPWVARGYRASVMAELEDVCGNDLAGPFDRPVRGNAGAVGATSALTFRFEPRA